MTEWRKAEWVFAALCAAAALLALLSLITCSTVTVVTGTNGATVSAEADKAAVILKPKSPPTKD